MITDKTSVDLRTPVCKMAATLNRGRAEHGSSHCRARSLMRIGQFLAWAQLNEDSPMSDVALLGRLLTMTQRL